MCTVSNVGDGFFPNTPSYPAPLPWPYKPAIHPVRDSNVDEILEFIRNLEKAKKYDDQTNQPDCVDPNKVKIIDEVIDRLLVLIGKAEFKEDKYELLEMLAALEHIKRKVI